MSHRIKTLLTSITNLWYNQVVMIFISFCTQRISGQWRRNGGIQGHIVLPKVSLQSIIKQKVAVWSAAPTPPQLRKLFIKNLSERFQKRNFFRRWVLLSCHLKFLPSSPPSSQKIFPTSLSEAEVLLPWQISEKSVRLRQIHISSNHQPKVLKQRISSISYAS